MKLVPCERIDTIKRIMNSDIFNTIMEFKESEIKCAKIEGFPHKNAKICACSFRNTIRHYKIHGVVVSVRGNEVYLIKEDL